MKSYTITVNGTAYEVTVEETGSVSAPALHLTPPKGSTWRLQRRLLQQAPAQ